MIEPADTDLRRFILGMAELVVVAAVIGAAALWGGGPGAIDADAPTAAHASVAR